MELAESLRPDVSGSEPLGPQVPCLGSSGLAGAAVACTGDALMPPPMHRIAGRVRARVRFALPARDGVAVGLLVLA